MGKRPPDLIELIERVLLPSDDAGPVGAAEQLAAGVRIMLQEERDATSVPAAAAEVFRDFYHYVHEYVAKVGAACERGDVLAAGYAAAMLEEQVAQLLHLCGAGYLPTEFDLAGEYRAEYLGAGLPRLHELAAAGDLAALAAAVRAFDRRMRDWLTHRDIDLRVFDGADELRAFLRARYRD